MTIFVVGGLSVDHLVNIHIGMCPSRLGGPALYSSLGARMVTDAPVAALTVLPEDEPRFLNEFKKWKIDISKCEKAAHASRLWLCTDDAGRVIMPVAQQGHSELRHNISKPMSVDGAQDATSAVFPVKAGTGDIVLLSSPHDIHPRYASAEFVLVDPHQDYVFEEGANYFDRLVDQCGSDRLVLLPSRIQLLALGDNPKKEAEKLSNRYQTKVVARLDQEGMAVFSPDLSALVTDRSVSTFDATGAGDTTAGVIAGMLTFNDDVVTASRYAVAAARILLSDWSIQGISRFLERFINDPARRQAMLQQAPNVQFTLEEK